MSEATIGEGWAGRWGRRLAAIPRLLIAPFVFFARNPLMLPVFGLPVAYFQRLSADDMTGALVCGAAALVYGAVLFALRGRSFMSLLAIRYLFKRRIAIVAVLSVTLCTAMVLAVASIMEGFMKSAREAMHKAKGDLTLQGDFRGFAFYDEFCRRAAAGHESLRDPETGQIAVKRAAPLMNTLAMAEIPWGAGDRVNPARVVGVRPADIVSDENFKVGLDPTGAPPLRLTDESLAALKADKVPEPVIKKLEALRNCPFTSAADFEMALSEPVASGAGSQEPPAPVLTRAEIDRHGQAIAARLVADPVIGDPAEKRTVPVLAERAIRVRDRSTGVIKVFKGSAGYIIGKDMVSVRDSEGKLHPMVDTTRPLRLTLLPPDVAGVSAEEAAPIKLLFQWERNHRTGVYDQDRGTVYLDFDYLQRKLRSAADPEEGVPALCSAVQIDLAEGVPLDRGRRIIARAWNKMINEIEAEQRAAADAKPGTPLPDAKAGPKFKLRTAERLLRDGRIYQGFPDLDRARHAGGHTGLAKPANAGDTVISVVGSGGFDAGDQVEITAGEIPERNVVEEVGHGTLRLRSPLRGSHPTDLSRGSYDVRTVPAGVVETVTWEESMATFLSAVQKEKVMMLILFGIISMVAVLLVLSIFIQIVKEKTRDIGIIKSVGAGNGAVAGVFLLYALCIGLVGSSVGLVLGSAFVWNINAIHDVIAKMTGVIIWDPSVYVLAKIPSTVSATDAAWVGGIAIIAALIAAVVPASLAARLPPVRALAYE